MARSLEDRRGDFATDTGTEQLAGHIRRAVQSGDLAGLDGWLVYLEGADFEPRQDALVLVAVLETMSAAEGEASPVMRQQLEKARHALRRMVSARRGLLREVAEDQCSFRLRRQEQEEKP